MVFILFGPFAANLTVPCKLLFCIEEVPQKITFRVGPVWELIRDVGGTWTLNQDLRPCVDEGEHKGLRSCSSFKSLMLKPRGIRIRSTHQRKQSAV